MAVAAELLHADQVAAVDRAEWLHNRQRGIGASEAAAVLRLSPYQTPLGLYLDKVGLAPPVEETEAMRLGLLLEPVLAKLYTERTGRAISATQVFRWHPERRHACATLDAVDDAGDLVEFKSIGAFAARGRIGDEDTDALPEHWLIQAQQQMAVFDAPRVRFGVLVGGQSFKTFTVDRDEDLAGIVLERVERFWTDHVEPRRPPEASGLDVGLLSRIRPEPGGPVVELPPELVLTAESYDGLGRQIKALEAHRDDRKARLLAAMGPAERAVLLGGWQLSRSVRTRKEHVIKESTWVQFSVKAPKEERE